jgi:hypothetical protein
VLVENQFIVLALENDMILVTQKMSVYGVGWHEPTPKFAFMCRFIKQKRTNMQNPISKIKKLVEPKSRPIGTRSRSAHTLAAPEGDRRRVARGGARGVRAELRHQSSPRVAPQATTSCRHTSHHYTREGEGEEKEKRRGRDSGLDFRDGIRVTHCRHGGRVSK